MEQKQVEDEVHELVAELVEKGADPVMLGVLMSGYALGLIQHHRGKAYALTLLQNGIRYIKQYERH